MFENKYFLWSVNSFSWLPSTLTLVLVKTRDLLCRCFTISMLILATDVWLQNVCCSKIAFRSDKTPYARQNGGLYNFVFDGQGNALPDDQVCVTLHYSTTLHHNTSSYHQKQPYNYQMHLCNAIQYAYQLLSCIWLSLRFFSNFGLFYWYFSTKISLILIFLF